MTDPSFQEIPLPLTELSRLHLTTMELQVLRQMRRDRLAPLLRAEQNKLQAYARQLKHRKHADLTVIQRGVSRTIAQYKRNLATWESWLPPYAGIQDEEGLWFDPEALDHEGMSIRDSYGLKTSLGPQVPKTDRLALREGRTMNAAARDWIVNLYANLDAWVPLRGSGRKSRRKDSFFDLKRRTRPLALTVMVANHYLPDLQLTVRALEKLVRPRLDHEKRKRNKSRTYRKTLGEDVLQTVRSIRQRPSQRDTRAPH